MADDAAAMALRPTARGGPAHGHRLAFPWFPATVVATAITLAIFGEYVAPHSPIAVNLAMRLTPPAWQADGTWTHPFGTDALGRDILSRMIAGTRISLLVALTAITAGVSVGTVVGLAAAQFGGRVDAILSRLMDSVLPIPMVLIGVLLAILNGASFTNVVIAIAFAVWARFARVVRGEALAIKHRAFVDLARIAGAGPMWIMWHHLLPNVMNTIFVLVTLQVGWVILMEASLSFLGAGVPPPAPTWGRMVADGRSYVTEAWWVATIPGFMILLLVLSLNLLGDWLRDRLDPKLKQL